jgi:UDP-N-acetyl-D-mannosaminuronic acid dehydrogenase
MALSDLRARIESRQALLAVVGLGYVGLPVACEFARVGFDVLGVEQNSDRVAEINSGELPFNGVEPGLAELLLQALSSEKFRATSNYAGLSERDIVLICVETPIDHEHIPQYHALRSTLMDLGKVLKPGCLVIVESTVSPGTITGMVLPLLESSSGLMANHDFYLGICPERVMPGRLLANLRNLNRVVGGLAPDTAETMKLLYRNITIADLDITDCLTAELVKTVENAYRDVQIAFANEIALICEAVGGDVWQVRELVNKSPGRQMHYPGAGVGGHCIPKDPWLLTHSVVDGDVPVRLIPAARQVNDSMPAHLAWLVQTALQRERVEISKASVLIMGYAYLEESDDPRNSPSEIVREYLVSKGANVHIHDPYVPGYQGSIEELALGCDALVIAVKHSLYQTIDWPLICSRMRTPILVDGRGFMDASIAKKAGFTYLGLGRDVLKSG